MAVGQLSSLEMRGQAPPQQAANQQNPTSQNTPSLIAIVMSGSKCKPPYPEGCRAPPTAAGV